MQSLSHILSRITDDLAFDPKLQRYTDSLTRRVQTAYRRLASSNTYEFFIRVATLQLYAEVTGLEGTRELTSVPGNTRALTSADLSWCDAGWAGNGTFIGEDGTEYGIVRVDTTGSGAIYLDAEVAAPLSGSATYGWSIEFRSYLLPGDTHRVLGYRDDQSDDGSGRMVSVGQRAAERMWLDPDHTGTPGNVVADEGAQRRAPLAAPTLTPSGGGSLPTGRKLSYRYTILGQGLESAPSPEATVKLTGLNSRVSVGGLEDIRWGVLDSGLQVRVYRRDLTLKGPWMAVATLSAPDAVAGHTDNTLLPTYASNYDDAIYDDPEGTRQRSRFYLTADADRAISLRLWFRPRPPQGASDMLRGPGAVDDYVVNSVLADVLAGVASTTHAGRAEEATGNLKSSLGSSDVRHLPRSWKRDLYGDGRPSHRDRNLGTPSRS